MISILDKKVITLCAAAVLGASGVQASETIQSGVSVRAGIGNNYTRAEIAWTSPSLWTYHFSENGGRLDLVAELGAAYWMANGSRSPSSAGQFSAIPFLRWTWGDRYYLEAGVGPTVFTRTRFADKNISTAFQFGNHVGVGAHLSDRSSIGLRFSHFSNAGIKRPNPGLEVLQLLYTYQY